MKKLTVIRSALVILPLLAALGCDKSADTRAAKDSEKTTAGEADKATDKGSDAKPLASADKGPTKPAVNAVPEAAPCGDSTKIPNIPSETSKPPSIAEWDKGCAVNTQGANSQAKDCTIKVVREWLNVTCRGKVLGHELMKDFGEEGNDYFKLFKDGKLGSFVVRLRKGHSQKVRICRENDRASLFVSWPGSKAQPTIIALALGQKCDGTTWGNDAKKAAEKAAEKAVKK